MKPTAASVEPALAAAASARYSARWAARSVRWSNSVSRP